MRVIIIAAGEGTRWGDYGGTTKHYAVLDGEPIIERTVRLLKERGVDEVIVASKDYKVAGVSNVYPKLDYENNADADKFLSTQPLWSRKGRTIILYGDVYFTEKAIDTVLDYEGRRWRLFCRPTALPRYKYPYGECFAVSFYPHDIAHGKEMLHRIAELSKSGYISKCGGWQWARAMAGLPDRKIGPHITALDVYYPIHDLTNDIDFPEDYERLKAAIAKEAGHAKSR